MKAKNINEFMGGNQQAILVVHHESGDEIHFNILPAKLINTLEQLIEESVTLRTGEASGKLVEFIFDKSMDDLMCQTYVIEEFRDINKYDILTSVYVPDLAF